MRKHRALILLAVLLAAVSIGSRFDNPKAASPAFAIPAPEDVLGFKPGDDRKLASWDKVVEYFQKLAATSDRVKFAELGKTTMGAPFVMATISAPENLARLDEYRKIQEQLADPRKLGPNADQKAADLIKRGKTIVMITCGIHSDEVGSYLSSMLIAHRLASSSEPEIQQVLDNTIILLVPSLNPDGVDIVKNWYDKTLGTPYEGTDPPELYHKYTGHDDNRDWYAFTQIETQLTVDKIHNVWHPQIVHDIHQQGEYGSRLFLPPYMQPVEPNVPKQIVAGYTELGSYIAKEMRAAGFKGITTDSTYDAWSPSRAYSHYHGGVRMLSETASCKIATPITVKFEELRPGQNYDPRKEAANFGPVWQGGEWHLRDITTHMATAAFLLLRHAAENRELWLRRFYEIEKEAVRPRLRGELWGFRISSKSNWTSYYLEAILKRGGVEVIYTKRTPIIKNPPSPRLWAAQEALVRLDQPYGGFAKALLEAQHYPDLRNSSGHPIQPYDVTAHTLPLLMNVQVEPLFQPIKYESLAVERLEFLQGKGVPFTRIAIYKSHVPAIDEGWTRWVIRHDANFLSEIVRGQDEEENGTRTINLWSLEDREASAGNLRAKFDTIIIPDQPARTILNGHSQGTMPAAHSGGLGADGVKALREFVEQGGTLVCLNRASDFAIEQLKLPLRDVVGGLPRTEFYAPGSILRIELERTNPLTYDRSQVMNVPENKGNPDWSYDRVPPDSIAWIENSPVFEVIGAGDENVHIIARYPKDKDPLLSGWLLGGERIKGKAALVEVTMGKGRIILFGFRPQYRGQSLATYPLFFNAITSGSH